MTKKSLWKHQEEILVEALRHNEFGLFCEMGTGKTRTCIEILRRHYQAHGKLLKTLIVGPSVVVENWKREFLEYSKIQAKDITLLQGTGVKRGQIFAREVMGHNKIVVCNFQTLLMSELFSNLLDWKPDVVIVDESHRIKNPQAKTTKALIQLGDIATYRYILTGTPILQSLMDLFSQFRFMDKGETFGRNFFIFRNSYFYDRNSGMPSQRHFPDWRVKPGAEEEIKKKIFLKSKYVKKSDCLDLPPLVRKHVYIELSPEQEKHYKAMKKDFITFLEDKACTAQLAITKALRLQQIVSGFIKLEDGSEVKLKNNPRLEALKDLLEELTLEHKVIVWACWRENYEQIRGVCRELGIAFVELHGEVASKQRQEAMDAFNQDPRIRVFIGNQGAAGIGINLTASDYSIYYSRNFSLEHDLQSEARNYRGGSEIHSKITRIDLVAQGTIDEHVMEALASKQEISETVLRRSVDLDKK